MDKKSAEIYKGDLNENISKMTKKIKSYENWRSYTYLIQQFFQEFSFKYTCIGYKLIPVNGCNIWMG